MNKKYLLKHVGSIEQIGGVRSFTFDDGKAKGVRAIEINTGKLRVTILPDRCMDIADASFMGENISWISKTGITAPSFYEKEEKGFLRSFFGGLVTTCGLKNIGGPVNGYGLHGRIGNIPAEKVSVNTGWVGDDYVMTVSGEMRESVVFGENLVLRRTITAKLFEDSFTLCDTVFNEGFNDENIALCYHCNFGYPLVSENSKILNIPEKFSTIPSPQHNIEEECIPVEYKEDVVTCGIENEDMGAYITYKRDTLPDFLLWKMVGESEYVVGLEPRTTQYGGDNIAKNNAFITLKPFEDYNTYLEFSFTKKK